MTTARILQRPSWVGPTLREATNGEAYSRPANAADEESAVSVDALTVLPAYMGPSGWRPKKPAG